MISRSIQAEVTFGDMKNVEFEILMVACGHNMREFARRMGLKAEDLRPYGYEKSCLS